MSGELQLEWFGCTTYRLTTAGLTLMLDAYLDKAPGAEPAGLSAELIDECDFVFLTHAHFDHMVDAAAIAVRTGATVVGSYESMRVLRAQGVPQAQLLPVSGGELVACSDQVSARVLPGLHSCLFAAAQTDSAVVCHGDLGVSAQGRRQAAEQVFALLPQLIEGGSEYFARTAGRCSPDDGGQLIYLLQAPAGSVLLSASSGHWTELIRDLRPDLALLALAGRPNVDGEPYQGSLADFLLEQVQLLQPQAVALCHHDALLPPVVPAVDTTEAVRRLKVEASAVSYLELQPLTAVTLSFGDRDARSGTAGDR